MFPGKELRATVPIFRKFAGHIHKKFFISAVSDTGDKREKF
jgi:hypothetical protein